MPADDLGPERRRRMPLIRDALRTALPGQRPPDIGQDHWDILGAFVAGAGPDDLTRDRGVQVHAIASVINRAHLRFTGESVLTWLRPDGTLSPLAVETDPESGCQVWRPEVETFQQGPRATPPDALRPRLAADPDTARSRRVYVRRAVYVLANGPVPGNGVVWAPCGNPRCVALAHAKVIQPAPRERPGAGHSSGRQPPRRRPAAIRAVDFRDHLSALLPAERPHGITPRRWDRARRFAGGETIIAIAAEDGVSRQAVWQDLHHLRSQLVHERGSRASRSPEANRFVMAGDLITPSEAGRRLGLDSGTVSNRARRYGLGREVDGKFLLHPDELDAIRQPIPRGPTEPRT